MPQAIIGLEVHVQLDTASKLFCRCPSRDDLPPNTAVCPVCLGHPGTLPVPNGAAVELGVRAALALGAEIHADSEFARKQYFYPDLPKGYQITQYDRPLATGGHLRVGDHDVRLRRLHVEEDSGRSHHHRDWTGVDYNRAGVPLVEIVSEPDLRSPAEAEAYLRLLHRVLVSAGVTRGDLERGHFRCDANVSLRGSDGLPGSRVEIKNVNSFRFVARALAYEIARQSAVLRDGGTVERETRTWQDGRTVVLRGKEETADYRYLPDPDLPAVHLPEALIARARAALPGVPLDRWLIARDAEERDAFLARYALEPALADALLGQPEARAFFEAAVAAGGAPADLASWVAGEVLHRVNEGDDLASAALEPAALVALQVLVDDGTLSRALAREVLDVLWRQGGDPATVAAERGLRQESDRDRLRAVVAGLVAEHPEEAARYRAGNRRVAGFFMGEVMRATQCRADPVVARRLVEEELARV